MSRIAIVGGGPGGLLTAHLLQQHCKELCELTVFEASPRLGGKVTTERFDAHPVPYEAGVAELYDYSHFGPDPLKQLVVQLGLSTVPMCGNTVILGDKILRHSRDIRRQCGAATLTVLQEFQRRCRELCSPADYYEGHWQDDNNHPWSDKTFREVLDEIPDETARRYLAVASRSDVATEPHLTSALNGLKNVLMDDPEYLRLYSIQGGIECLVKELAKHLTARILLNCPVVGVAKNADGGYQVTTRRDSRQETHDFDLVVLALPNYWLGRLDWGSKDLRLALDRHLAHYDRPAHYLRVTLLFQKHFWRDQIPGSYFMVDSFGGCCVYDEGSRLQCGPFGVLGWLIAGNDAQALANLDDDTLMDMALDSLPEPLAHGRKLYVEGRVHRWIGTVSAMPGGRPVHEPRDRHLPEPIHHPGLFLVGDYLFDSTINGAFDSADFVTDMILSLLRKQHYLSPQAETRLTTAATGGSKAVPPAVLNGHLDKDYHDLYDGENSYARSFKEFFCEHYTADLIREVWGRSSPYKLLDVGSASGLTLEAFDKIGIEAWGVENSEHIHSQTPAKWLKRNLRGDVRALPFPDQSFDFVYDTCLCYVPPDEIDLAIRELFRVARVGVFFGGITSDMTPEVIEAYDLFESVRTLCTLWEWSEMFLRNGFRMALTDPKVLARVWQIETDANEGDAPLYPDAESMRHCFFTKPDSPTTTSKRRRKPMKV